MVQLIEAWLNDAGAPDFQTVLRTDHLYLGDHGEWTEVVHRIVWLARFYARTQGRTMDGLRPESQ